MDKKIQHSSSKLCMCLKQIDKSVVSSAAVVVCLALVEALTRLLPPSSYLYRAVCVCVCVCESE